MPAILNSWRSPCGCEFDDLYVDDELVLHRLIYACSPEHLERWESELDPPEFGLSPLAQLALIEAIRADLEESIAKNFTRPPGLAGMFNPPGNVPPVTTIDDGMQGVRLPEFRTR